MRIVSTIGATSTSHDGTDYAASADGTFDVPEHVGAVLVAFPLWQLEYVALDARLAAAATAATDPARQAERIADLERQVADLLAAATTPAPKDKTTTKS